MLNPRSLVYGIRRKGISNCRSQNCIVLVCVIPNRVPCEVKVTIAGVKWSAMSETCRELNWIYASMKRKLLKIKRAYKHANDF